MDAISWAIPGSVPPPRLGEDQAAALRSPFKLTTDGVAQTSEASFELKIDGVEYNYGLEVDDEEFVHEWLYSYPRSRARKLFERTRDQVAIGPSVEGRKGVSAIASKVRPSRSILTVLEDIEVPEWQPVISWFKNVKTLDRGMQNKPLSSSFFREIKDNALLIELVRKADVGVRDMEVQEQPRSSPSGLNEVIETLNAKYGRNWLGAPTSNWFGDELVFFHNGSDVSMRLSDQSHGTLQFLSFAYRIVSILKSGGVALVDEIEASLHPRLVPRIIELFRNPASNPYGAQLIVTTHDTSLLSTSLGEPVLRRDEIWLAKKSPEGESTIVPLSDFKPRKAGENRERKYLGGSYGAVPAVFTDSLVEVVAEHFSEETDHPSA